MDGWMGGWIDGWDDVWIDRIGCRKYAIIIVQHPLACLYTC